jgi:hypothetical protein
MQVRCVKAFGGAVPGEIVSGLPDGSIVDPDHWEIVPYEPSPAPDPVIPASVPSAAAVTPKEM